MLRRLSLRARLILGVIALSALGLVTADVITYTSLHRFLISRTDDFLDTAHVSAESGLHGPCRGPPHGGQQGPDAAGRPDIGRLEARVPGLFVQVRRANGTIVATGAAPQFSGTTQSPPPRLPKTIALTSRRGADRVSYFSVPATKGEGGIASGRRATPVATGTSSSSRPRSRASTARSTSWSSWSCL